MTVYDLLDAWYTKFEAYGSERNKQGQLSVVAQASYRGATSPRHFDIRVGFNEYANSPGKRIATILCDTGFRYLSTLYDPAWREAKGLA